MDNLVVIIIVVLLLILFWIHFYKNEYLTEPYFLNQMAMDYSDPIYFNYLGRSERDVEGNSMQDYYLQNQMDAATGVLPQMFNDEKFFNQDDYMDMPIVNRPLRNPSASKLQIQSRLISNNMEENAFRELNQAGAF